MSYAEHGNKKKKSSHEHASSVFTYQHEEPYRQKMDVCKYEKGKKKSERELRSLMYERSEK